MLPEGFSPLVVRNLYLNNVTSIPKGFSPTVRKHLYLNGLRSIPVGFSPTVGGDLFLYNLTSIPEEFSPTVGGNVYINCRNIKKKKGLPKGYNFSWQGKYIFCDGIFSEVVSKKKNVYKIREIFDNTESYLTYLVVEGEFSAHGRTLEEAKNDLVFKINHERLKKEPITPNTWITIDRYRAITGACEFGIKSWMEANGINSDRMKASELLPLLEKTNAYGLDEFKKMIVH